MKIDKSKWYFNQLAIGDKFKLLNSDEICTKISKRKYKTPSGNEELMGTVYFGVVYLVD